MLKYKDRGIVSSVQGSIMNKKKMYEPSYQ